MKWYRLDLELEVSRTNLERQANALLRRRRSSVRRTPRPERPPPMAPSPSEWLPLSDLRRALQAKKDGGK
jgi:hypothetical protein